MMTTLPAGYKLSQLRAEQPVTTFDMFKREILNEIARCLNMPYNIAAGNSSGYNYSSGRLDHQTYYRGIDVDRSEVGCKILDRLFYAWLAETALVEPALVPGRDLSPRSWPHRWLWQGLEHVDPQKEAHADEMKLKNYATSFSEQCYKDGVDPDARAKMIADDMARFERLGIEPPAAWRPPPTPGQSPPQKPDGGEDDDEDQGDGKDAQAGFVHRNGYHRP
jgi:capsid protein